jgi:hypothetical protein
VKTTALACGDDDEQAKAGAAALLVSAATMLCALAAGIDGWVGNGWAVEAD